MKAAPTTVLQMKTRVPEMLDSQAITVSLRSSLLPEQRPPFSVTKGITSSPGPAGGEGDFTSCFLGITVF